jgi:hypothetical protein
MDATRTIAALELLTAGLRAEVEEGRREARKRFVDNLFPRAELDPVEGLRRDLLHTRAELERERIRGRDLAMERDTLKAKHGHLEEELEKVRARFWRTLQRSHLAKLFRPRIHELIGFGSTCWEEEHREGEGRLFKSELASAAGEQGALDLADLVLEDAGVVKAP